MNDFRAGYATILGRPNVGKSTLLNTILGEKIAIASARPQTTRERLAGIFTDEHRQIVFVDTPGLIQPRDRFNEAIVHQAHEALSNIDVALHLVDAQDVDPLPPEVREALARVAAPIFLVVNKIDRLHRPFAWETWRADIDVSAYAERFAVSALHGDGVGELVDAVGRRMPVGEPFFDPDDLTDRDLRYLAAERVREQVFILTREEIPYGVATRTEEFRERDDRKPYIAVTIYVERESQKGVLVGHDGAMIKAIGQAARGEIETLVGSSVFLDLRVKVRPNWRKSDAALREFGYTIPKRPRGKGGHGPRRGR